MYRPLGLCPACRRHVRADEPACPFCLAPLDPGRVAPARIDAGAGLTRSAAFALGATLALASCSSAVTNSDARVDDPADAPAADVPAVDTPLTDVLDARVADVFDASMRDAPDDDGTLLAMYGLPPPFDAARDVADDKGGAVPLYGAPPPPPPPDAGR